MTELIRLVTHRLQLSFITALALLLSVMLARAETLRVRSENPFNFVDILSGAQSDSIDLDVDLVFPDGHQIGSRVAAVVFVHGAGGPQAHHHQWLTLFRDLGLATAYADHFAPRGKGSAVGSHIQLTGAAMTADAFHILNALTEHPDIDPDRIVIMGASKGGGVALYSTWKPLQKILSPGRRFAAHIPLYPTCVSWDEPNTTESPVLVLLAAEDNWTGVDLCINSVETFKQKGFSGFDFKVYENAPHGFDSGVGQRSISNAYSVINCRFSIGSDGSDFANGIFMETPQLKRKALGKCISRGVTYGGNRDALAAARKDVNDFLHQVVLD